MEILNRYPMRAYPNPSLAEAEGVAPLFCISAQLFGADTLGRRLYLQQVLVQRPTEAGLIGAPVT